MKKFILFSVLCALSYAAIGNAGKEGKEAAEALGGEEGAAAKAPAATPEAKAAAEPEAVDLESAAAAKIDYAGQAWLAHAAPTKAALSRLEASVKEIEALVTTSCEQLVPASQAWQRKTDEAHAEVHAACKFIWDKKRFNPLSMLVVHIEPEEGDEGPVYERAHRVPEDAISDRAGYIESVIKMVARFAQAEAVNAQTYCGVEATAPAAPADDDFRYLMSVGPEIRELEALCSEITKKGGRLPLGKTRPEMGAISEGLLVEQREKIAQMEPVFVSFLKATVQHNEEVEAFVDYVQFKGQELLQEVSNCMGYFFDMKSGKRDKVQSVLDLADELWDGAQILVARVNKNSDEMRTQCSRTLDYVRGIPDGLVPGEGINSPRLCPIR